GDRGAGRRRGLARAGGPVLPGLARGGRRAAGPDLARGRALPGGRGRRGAPRGGVRDAPAGARGGGGGEPRRALGRRRNLAARKVPHPGRVISPLRGLNAPLPSPGGRGTTLLFCPLDLALLLPFSSGPLTLRFPWALSRRGRNHPSLLAP